MHTQQQLPANYDYSKCFGIKAFSCQLDPECYLCEYTRACHWAANAPKPDTRSALVSYENFSYSAEVATAAAIEDDPDDTPEYSRRDFAELLSFLLRMDEYTLKLASDALTGNVTSVSELARLQGVSRQAMHQKMARAVKQYPEIKELLLGNLFRCRRIMREPTSEAQRIATRGTGKQAATKTRAG